MSKSDKNTQPQFLFGKKNYMFMIIGLACIALGFILMAGGGSDDPNVWNEAINNFQRIRLAPTLVIVGLGIQIYAILLTPNKEK
jgi:sulfite exporter TauE/SafE